MSGSGTVKHRMYESWMDVEFEIHSDKDPRFDKLVGTRGNHEVCWVIPKNIHIASQKLFWEKGKVLVVIDQLEKSDAEWQRRQDEAELLRREKWLHFRAQ